jgi:hypothetical protein
LEPLCNIVNTNKSTLVIPESDKGKKGAKDVKKKPGKDEVASY